MYIVPGAGAGPIFPDNWNPEKLYNLWGGASDFDTHTLNNPHMIGSRNYYAEYDLLKGLPQIRGAEFCIWNDSAGGISDYDLFDRAKDCIHVLSEKTWYGDTDRFEDGAEFMESVNSVDDYAPGVNPGRYVAADDQIIAQYDFESLENNSVSDIINGNDADAVNASLEAGKNGQALKLSGDSMLNLPFSGVGYPYTVEFDLYLDGTQDEDAILFDGKDGTLYLDYKDKGLSFVRGKYAFTFNEIFQKMNGFISF